jgi:hypothetical protein
MYDAMIYSIPIIHLASLSPAPLRQNLPPIFKHCFEESWIDSNSIYEYR